MTKNILILLFIITMTAAWTYFSNEQISKNSLPSEKVSDFKFETLKNEKYSLYDLKGKPVFLHFWATWCAPCIEELPQLIDLAHAQPEKITIIAIAVNDKKKDIQRFLTKTQKDIPDNFIVGLDPEKAISKDLYKTIKLPETYILTPDLVLLEKITGPKDRWKIYYGKN